MPTQAHLPPIALTMGEPSGIGPELLLKLYQHQAPTCDCVVIADIALLQELKQRLKFAVKIQAYEASLFQATKPAERLQTLWVVDVPCKKTAYAGKLDPANADAVLACLDAATDGCMSGEYRAMVTAPLHKGVINEAGHHFTGHTEYLAQRAGVSMPVMMLATQLPSGHPFRVALVTTHLPLSKVAEQITTQRLTDVVSIVNQALTVETQPPRILMTGLNPHAGESGHLGREEIEIIEPVVDSLRQSGLNIMGPLPADTLFAMDKLERCDVVVAMYHDQGLPVLKHVGFGQAVNITLGLPFVRTSVDHGTALDIAGTGQAEISSMVFAIEEADRLSSGHRLAD